MDFIYILFLVGFFGGILCFAAACGAYSAISNKLDDIADKYREDNLRLADQLDRANIKARRYQTERDNCRAELNKISVDYFVENAEKILADLKKEKNLPSAN